MLRVTTKQGETTRKTATGTDSKPAEVKTFGSSTLPLAAGFMWYTLRMPYKSKSQQNEYQRLWMAKRRDAWFEGKTCADCSETENLELDHVDASKKVSHRIWSWSKIRMNEELEKCVARCSAHHKRKTIENKEHAVGVSIASSKLTEDQVREIRLAHSKGSSKRGLARLYGVDEKAIRLVVARKTWSHVL